MSTAKRSDLEVELAFQLKAAKVPGWEEEYRFAPPRRFRADFAWPELRLLVEVEGGSWIAGRHNRGAGFASDCTKYNLAALAGWTVLRFTREHIQSGEALSAIEQMLGVLSGDGVTA